MNPALRVSRLLRREVTSSPRRPSSSYAEFQGILNKSKKIVALSGAGISAESGIPTFRGVGGLWRTYDATNLATLQAFRADPSLVWEFYHHRREIMKSKHPNSAHTALAQLEMSFEGTEKELTIVTQNIDGLHQNAGSKNVLELHGSLFRVRCTLCGSETVNRDSPICDSLQGKGAPEPNTPRAQIPKEELPACNTCGGLLRPAVVWFGEGTYNINTPKNHT
eukprot:TRINITY_DN7801_c0_g1_i3.p1 TRINITY_DN7801_c0_g1~~TRINITY_DN7801_c0_g1_i3.p1  ORF type:complete len:222 (-),score=25.31 TRINITY_DN7801_c0_g1_i3:51-716(-)